MTIHTRISGSIAATVLGLTAVLGTAAPAAAGPPEINQKDCEAAGGTFDRVKGVKSCTTISSHTTMTGPYSRYYSGGVFTPSYQSFWSEVWTWEDTTVQSQKGNGEVTTTPTSVLISRNAVNKQCLRTWFGSTSAVPVSECEALGLYAPF